MLQFCLNYFESRFQGHWAILPPSTGSITPVMKEALSEARYSTASAISWGRPLRPRGCLVSCSFSICKKHKLVKIHLIFLQTCYKFFPYCGNLHIYCDKFPLVMTQHKSFNSCYCWEDLVYLICLNKFKKIGNKHVNFIQTFQLFVKYKWKRKLKVTFKHLGCILINNVNCQHG